MKNGRCMIVKKMRKSLLVGQLQNKMKTQEFN